MVYETKTLGGNAGGNGNVAYRLAAGLALAEALVLLWINAAAGIIGDGPVNLLYLFVLFVGGSGALIAHFQPRGLALSLYATAVAQILVPLIALLVWKSGRPDLLVDPGSPHPPFDPGIVPVFVLNAVFALFWIVSAWLFRRSTTGPLASENE